MSRSSEVPGFYRRSTAERREFVRAWADLSADELRSLEFPPGVDPGVVERMIENVIGVLPVPVGIAWIAATRAWLVLAGRSGRRLVLGAQAGDPVRCRAAIPTRAWLDALDHCADAASVPSAFD